MSLGSLEEFPCSETVSISFNIHDTTVVSHEDIWIEDSLLIVKSQNRNGFLRFYSLNTGEFIKSYGVIGRGPGEVLVDREGNSFIFFHGKASRWPGWSCRTGPCLLILM